MNKKQEALRLGAWGEERACVLLQEKGWKILERNFHSKMGEIDIIAIKSNQLCFTEVKTRKSLNFGVPSLAVDNKKQIKIKKTADYYLITHPEMQNFQMQMDVIEILLLSKKIYIRHLENAFL